MGEDGDFVQFTASTEGTGADNPSDPTELTIQQKDRAVTVEFADAKVIEFEIGASAGMTGRVFSFVFRPSLLCAKTKMTDGSLMPATGADAPIIAVRSGANNNLLSAVWVVGFLSAVLQHLM